MLIAQILSIWLILAIQEIDHIHDYCLMDNHYHPCAIHSKLKKSITMKAYRNLLEKPLSKQEQKELEAEQKKKIVQTWMSRRKIA